MSEVKVHWSKDQCIVIKFLTKEIVKPWEICENLKDSLMRKHQTQGSVRAAPLSKMAKYVSRWSICYCWIYCSTNSDGWTQADMPVRGLITTVTIWRRGGCLYIVYCDNWLSLITLERIQHWCSGSVLHLQNQKKQ